MRQFQKRIHAADWSLLVVLAALAVATAWCKDGLLAFLALLLLVFHIDRTLHSCYIIGNESLQIRHSRFRPVRHIPLECVLRVERTEAAKRPFGLARPAVLVLTYATDEARQHTREVYIDPKNPDEFVEFLRKKKLDIPANP